MLRIHQITSPAAAKQYYAHADYYTEGQELDGHWFGEGARILGLAEAGPWNSQHFERLCDNLRPLDPGAQLTARQRADRTVAYDFNFNAPKGVSVLHALTGDPRIRDAFRAAVRDTMREVEREMKARVRKGRQDTERLTGNLVGSEFLHHTTRPINGVPDPALHAHCVVFNATWDDRERAWKAGYFRDLKRDAPYWEAAFHARLASNLRSIGYDSERRGKNWDVTAVSRATVAKFSRRTQEIEKLARDLGVHDPEAKAKLGATSRASKGEHQPWLELVRQWTTRLDNDERRALQEARARAIHPVASLLHAEERSLEHARAHLFTRKSVIPYRDLLAEALRHGVGHVSVEKMTRAARKVPLIRVKDAGRIMVTTPEVVLEEKAILRFAQQGQGTRSRLGKRGRPLKRLWLVNDQKRAVEHVLNSTDQVILIRGVAGTGKTTLTQEAVEAIEENGKKVILLAPSAEASRGVLRQEGFADADTVAMFLTNEKFRQQAKGQVVWVDEAGLLSTPDMARLFAAAKELDARVILTGDELQHASPNRGAAFRLLQEESGLPCVQVTDIRRQSGEYKKAVELLSQGQAREGLDKLDALGWIHEIPDGERDQALAQAYVETVAAGKTALVISPTHAEGSRVTSAIRGALQQAGRLGEAREFAVWQPRHLTPAEQADPHAYEPGDLLQFFRHAKGIRAGDRLTVEASGKELRDHSGAHHAFTVARDHPDRFGVYRPATLTLAVGDKIRMTSRGKTKDGRYTLNNGALFTVRGFTSQGDIVIDNGRIIDRRWGHLAHGYVLTSDASQGKTVDRVFVGQSVLSLPATKREQVYVSASRAREQVVLFTDDKQALKDAAQREDSRITATELLKRRRRSYAERWRKRVGFLRELASWRRRTTSEHEPRHQAGQTRG